jgi:hypothetical protein
MSKFQRVMGLLGAVSVGSIAMALFVGIAFMAGSDVVAVPLWLWMWPGVSGGIGVISIVGLVISSFWSLND